MSVSRPIFSTSVLGIALARTCFLDCKFSYRSDNSSSFCRSLSDEESKSDTVVRGLEPLLRCHSLVILGKMSEYFPPSCSLDLPVVLGRGILANLLLNVLDVALVYIKISFHHYNSAQDVQNGDGLPSLKIIRDVYSSSLRPRPASTSSDEEVTPPYRNQLRALPEYVMTHLVGTRVFEQYHALLLEPEPSLLSKEEVGTFNHIFEMWFALGIHESRNIGDVDCLGSDRIISFIWESPRVTHRPPQGTKRSALTRKWNELRKSVPSGTTSPPLSKCQ